MPRRAVVHSHNRAAVPVFCRAAARHTAEPPCRRAAVPLERRVHLALLGAHQTWHVRHGSAATARAGRLRRRRSAAATRRGSCRGTRRRTRRSPPRPHTRRGRRRGRTWPPRVTGAGPPQTGTPPLRARRLPAPMAPAAFYGDPRAGAATDRQSSGGVAQKHRGGQRALPCEAQSFCGRHGRQACEGQAL